MLSIVLDSSSFNRNENYPDSKVKKKRLEEMLKQFVLSKTEIQHFVYKLRFHILCLHNTNCKLKTHA